jgi:hypothetical protein
MIDTEILPVYSATAGALSAAEDRPVVGGIAMWLALWRALLSRVNLFLLHRCSDRSIVLNCAAQPYSGSLVIMHRDISI